MLTLSCFLGTHFVAISLPSHRKDEDGPESPACHSRGNLPRCGDFTPQPPQTLPPPSSSSSVLPAWGRGCSGVLQGKRLVSIGTRVMMFTVICKYHAGYVKRGPVRHGYTIRSQDTDISSHKTLKRPSLMQHPGTRRYHQEVVIAVSDSYITMGLFTS